MIYFNKIIYLDKIQFSYVKGTMVINLSEFKKKHVRFITVPFKPLSDPKCGSQFHRESTSEINQIFKEKLRILLFLIF